MKKIALLLFCLTISAHATGPFAVVLMVKNEETTINKTLEPFIQEGIQSFFIFDTGSTDNTIETVQHYFQEHGIHNSRIVQEPFINFATSRNRALDLAEEAFEDITFFLMPDAEWHMHNVAGLINFCEQAMQDNGQCYLVRIANDNIDFPVPRLFRANAGARFTGEIHESVVTEIMKKVPRNIYFELTASSVGIEKSRQRWLRDKEILTKKFEENPNNPRTTFYLAQTYECLLEFEDAYKFYKIRSQQNGHFEETYEAFYRLARVTRILARSHPEAYTWHAAMDCYFEAHKIMPHRAEPLVEIAQHYWPEGGSPVNAPLCYLFAKHAYALPYPENDTLFVDPEAYNFRRYELLSKAAWQVGDYALGEVCTRKAIAYKEMPYLLRNLAGYMEALGKV